MWEQSSTPITVGGFHSDRTDSDHSVRASHTHGTTGTFTLTHRRPPSLRLLVHTRHTHTYEPL